MAVPKRLVLDTDVIIEHLRGKTSPSLIRRLQDETALATTLINASERPCTTDLRDWKPYPKDLTAIA